MRLCVLRDGRSSTLSSRVRSRPASHSDQPSDRTAPLVCEITRRGKLILGEPWFEGGVPFALESRSARDCADGDLVAVCAGRRGRPRVLTHLGASKDIDAVLAGLLVQRELMPIGDERKPAELEAERLEELPASGRVDLRELLAVTIDPEAARDFDDAISVVQRDDGTFTVWVHIADVAAYVRPGLALDREAASRGFSVYVPGRVEPMLPERLSSDMCSLRASRDRLCVTTELTFDGDLRVTDATMFRSVIRVRERLTYSEVERLLSGRERASDGVGAMLEAAQTLAGELRRRRFANGALRIESREIEFEFDGEGGVLDAWFDSEPAAHALVEEMMIAANEAVGRLLADRRLPALFRVHERPEPQSIERLVTRLAAVEVPTPPVPEQLTPGDAAKLAAEVSSRVTDYTGTVSRGREAYLAMVLQALQRARYDPENLGHSGLASRAYCHFTSPIRRYPDLLCHRSLLRELSLSDDPVDPDLHELAEEVSLRERLIAKTEHEADDLCLAWLLERRLFEQGWDAVFDGEITRRHRRRALLPLRWALPRVSSLPRRIGGDFYELDLLATSLVGRRTGRTFRLGEPIRVQVAGLERTSGKVNLALCEENGEGALQTRV